MSLALFYFVLFPFLSFVFFDCVKRYCSRRVRWPLKEEEDEFPISFLQSCIVSYFSPFYFARFLLSTGQPIMQNGLDMKPALPHWDVGLIFPKWTFEDSTEKCKDFFRLGRLGSRTSRPAVVTDDARRDARHRRLCLPPSFPFVAAAFLGIAPSRESFLSLFPLILASGPKIARYLFGVLLGPARHCVCGLDQYVQHDAKKQNKHNQVEEWWGRALH